MTSSSGTRHLKNIDISVNSILTSMKTLINILPLFHWWKYSCPSNILSPFDINGKRGAQVLPLLSFFFSSSIVILHRYVTPLAMVLFLLAIWSMIDVFVFLHVLYHLPLSGQIPLAHEGFLTLFDQVEGIIIISCFSSMELLPRDDLSRLSMCNSSRIS